MSWRYLPHQWTASAYVAGVSMALFFWVGKVLGAERFGLYNYAMTWAAMGGLVLDGGFKTLIFREEIQNRSQGVIICQALGHLLAVLSLGFLAAAVQSHFSNAMLLAVMGYAAANTAANFYSAHLKAKGDFLDEAKWQIFCRSVSAVVILAAFYFMPQPSIIFCAWAVGILICLMIIRQWFKDHQPVFSFQARLYRPVLALILIDIATTLYFRIDILLLKFLNVPEAEIGRYASAGKVLEGLVLLSTPVAQIFFREMRLRWLEGNFFLKYLFNALILSMSVAVILTLLAGRWGEDGFVWLLGKEFKASGIILTWLMVSLIFILPNALLTQAALAAGAEWFYALAALAAAAGNIVLNLYLIPIHGILGAAWATVATEAVLTVGLLMGIGRWPKKKKG